MKEGNVDAAEISAEKLRTEYGPSSQLALLRGEIQLVNKNLVLAQTYLTSALEQDQSNTAALLQLYELSRRGQGGIEFSRLLEQRIKSAPQPVWIVKLLADSYLVQGEPALAAPHYESLIALESLEDNAAILNNLANIYAKTDLNKALATAMKGVGDTGNKSPALLDTIGWILAQQDRHEEALPYFREGIR